MTYSYLIANSLDIDLVLLGKSPKDEDEYNNRWSQFSLEIETRTMIVLGCPLNMFGHDLYNTPPTPSHSLSLSLHLALGLASSTQMFYICRLSSLEIYIPKSRSRLSI